VCLYCPTAFCQQNQVGFVLDIQGDWSIRAKPVHKGQAVEGKDEINISRNAKFANGKVCYINVILLNNTSVSKACSSRQSCREPLKIPPSVGPSSSLIQRIGEASLRLFARKPERYVPTLSRNILESEATLIEGVVKLEGQSLGLGDVVTNMTAGNTS
jgi:hypothetical protein